MFEVLHPPGRFVHVPPAKRDWTDPLTLHKRIDSRSQELLVFVHGLGGNSDTTWGKYPEFLLTDDSVRADVCVFDYESGLRRRLGRSISISKHADAFAHYVRDMKYKSIILIGHSMGGLICKGAVKCVLDSDMHDLQRQPTMKKLAGLVLYATPQSGTKRVPKFLSAFSKDAQVLRVGSSFVKEVNKRFQDRILTTPGLSGVTMQQRLPSYAVLATGDFWVECLSAGLGLIDDQKKIVEGTHTSIVKPASRADDAYIWFTERINYCFASAHATPDERLKVVGEGEVSTADLDNRIRSLLEIIRSGYVVPMHTNIPVTSSESTPDEDEIRDVDEVQDLPTAPTDLLDGRPGKSRPNEESA